MVEQAVTTFLLKAHVYSLRKRWLWNYFGGSYILQAVFHVKP